jgi:formaldehyde-activating enzyme involved in methanogenesis
VLDAVAEGLIPPSGDLVVLVCVWIDPGASDETAVRDAARMATLNALRQAAHGREADVARSLVDRRDSVTSPFYGGEP